MMCLFIAALAALAIAPAPPKPAGFVAAATATEDKYLETIKVADNIYVFKPKIDWTHGNGVAIIGPDGVFFIDTYIQFNYAEEAIRRLRKITKLPVQYVLNTHSHTDHVTGNAVFRRVFPASRIIAHDSAATRIETFNKPAVEGQAAGIQANIDQLESDLKTGKLRNGRPLSAALRPFWDLQIREAKEYQQQFRPEQFVPVDITFSDTLTVRWGKRTLRMIHVSENGHSAGDVIVWIPEERILVSGDLVVAPTPYATYINIPGMIKAIHTLIEMNPSIIILRGMGEVQHDLAYMRLSEEAFSAYRRAAEQAVAAKVPVTTAMDKASRFPTSTRASLAATR